MSSNPVSSGTGIFIASIVMVVVWAWALSRGNYISKDNFKVASVVAVMLGVCTWLMWLCAWMHQWHPLIVPTWKAEKS